LSDTVLAHLDKGHTRRDVFAALAAARRAGVPLRPTFLPFTPWARRSDYLELLAFVAAEGLVEHVDPVQLSLRLLVPPGSLLAASDAMRPHLGTLHAADFSYDWTHPDPDMDALQRRVAAVVEAAAAAEEPAASTFAEICAAAGAPHPPPAAVTLPPPPRMTEPWFC